jgi:ribulose-phosphate 3-epimerase
LNTDFARLADEIAKVPSADAIHIDVMDNHFVPNLTIGRPVVECLRRVTDLTLDVHLMIDNPDLHALSYVSAGADLVTFHLEAAAQPVELARAIRSAGAGVGVAIKPATPAVAVEALIPEIDQVLVMSVEPGFGGQTLMISVLPKVTDIRAMIERSDQACWLAMDGGISVGTIDACVEAGADSFVAGSAVFGSADPDGAIVELRRLAEQALGRRLALMSTESIDRPAAVVVSQ